MSTATETKPGTEKVRVFDNFHGKTIEVDAPKKHRHPVTLGQTVYWFPGGNPATAPRPAMVVAIGDRALKVMSIAEDSWGTNTIGVHHISDEVFQDPRQIDAKQAGGWDYAPEPIYAEGENDRKIAALAERLANLEDMLSTPRKTKEQKGQ